MSLKIVKIEPRLGRIVVIAAAIVCLATCWFFIKWNFASVIASRIETQRPESRLVADWLAQTAPSDPQTHFAAAVVFEKTFDQADLARSLSEYEMAAALSPHNYLRWLDLGKARSMTGDGKGAEAAVRRSLDLAPNYAAVQWLYGNLLVREGRPDEGFGLVAKAAASNPEYSKPAVLTALQIYDGDTRLVRTALGDVDVTNAALATTLAGQQRFDDACDAWSRIAAADRVTLYGPLGKTLLDQMTAAKKFQYAARIAADLYQNEAERPVVGQIVNGGFENGVKLRNAAAFQWQIGEGAQPEIGLGEGNAHEGRYSLWMTFDTFDPAAFRTVTQTVAVVPGAAYELELFYRSDLKTAAIFKWEVVDAVSSSVLVSSPPMPAAGDWTGLKTRFTVPAGSDGVIIRLARESCGGAVCAARGKLSFDDISLRRQ